MENKVISKICRRGALQKNIWKRSLLLWNMNNVMFVVIKIVSVIQSWETMDFEDLRNYKVNLSFIVRENYCTYFFVIDEQMT